MDVFEAMGTARAIRYLKPDPVAPEIIEKLIWAATRASSPSNSQAWAFVVVATAEEGEAVEAEPTSEEPEVIGKGKGEDDEESDD
jgi:nitroreductase